VGARVAVLLGEDEHRRGEVTLKNLADGSQVSCARGDLARTLSGYGNRLQTQAGAQS
jgi:histidyl-tRNA synthetase